ncbi:hypothetical protein NP233_g4862 [Leucocoprinus birnbaumii]|uniref:Uncharacterized protein n=1 Tax=Leucocoprinus birnbaumii TaxID=56174 RepID=A0AAD5YSE5_9AGAR|nr:hypothetical protein NP233_g4862 [Leucocoprinus birnbaumii]
MPCCRIFAFEEYTFWNEIRRMVMTLDISIPKAFLPASTQIQRNLFIKVSAQVIASFGFGLSIVVIWLRWFTHLLLPQRREWPDIKYDSLTSSHACPNTTPRKTIPHVARRTPDRCFGDPSLLLPLNRSAPVGQVGKIEVPDLPLLSSFPLDVDLIYQHSSISKLPTPIRSVSLPSSPAHRPELALGATTEGHDPDHRSSSTSRLMSKVKSPFHGKGKHPTASQTPTSPSVGSFPIPRPRRQIHDFAELPSLPNSTFKFMTPAIKNRKRKSSPFTTPWRRSCPEADVLPSKVTKERDALGPPSSSLASRLSPNMRLGSFSRDTTCHQSPTSMLFSRKFSHQPSPRPRTSPYEAPYFACPPTPVREKPLRSWSIGTRHDRQPSV